MEEKRSKIWVDYKLQKTIYKMRFHGNCWNCNRTGWCETNQLDLDINICGVCGGTGELEI